MEIELKPVNEQDIDFLYELLKEREAKVNISHKKLPSFSEHEQFVKSSPYPYWDIILLNNERIGNIYLTNRDELGIFISKDSQSRGAGSIVLQKFMKKMGKKDTWLISIQQITNQFSFLGNMASLTSKIHITKKLINEIC